MLDKKRTSKFLSLVLRHNPDKIGITLDKNGWTDINVLLVMMKKHGHVITRAELEDIVATCEKQRYKIADNKIRANQGHSVAIDLGLKFSTPPDVLYHGTAKHFLPGIRKEGLVKKSRQHVHLSDNLDTAIAVGKRHGEVVILEIDAIALACTHEFYLSENGVWLVDNVPPDFISVDGVKLR